MLLLSVADTADITQMIPPVYLAAFAAVMAVVLFAANKWLTAMFIPKNGSDEAPLWSYYRRKNGKKK
ncbi:MAG: hypothetical protein IJ410_06625 [Oscillospiraceae bacterium]|nr:hypothetical protein [Oscillospiraceae bacterium]